MATEVPGPKDVYKRQYQESLQDELLTDINNNVLGDKYSLIGAAVYEKQFSKGNSMSFGLPHTQSFANNEYRNGHYYETDMNQGATYVYGEYRGKVKKLDYRLGVCRCAKEFPFLQTWH